MANVNELYEKMTKGIVTFQYQKNNGQVRTAKGTLNPDFVEDNYAFRGGSGPAEFGYTPYWDVDKNDWRCFRDCKFMGIVEA